MYSIIQAFGINYAENSSIIKQIKKPKTGDAAGSPSEGTGGCGQLDPVEGPEGEGQGFVQEQMGVAQERPRPWDPRAYLCQADGRWGRRGGLQPSPQLRIAAAGEAGGVGGRAALGWAGEGCGEQAQRRPLAAKGTVSQTWRWRRPTGLLLLS